MWVSVCGGPALEQYGDVHIYKTSFRGMKHTLTKREEKTLMKLIVHPETDKVLAVHMCGYVLLSAVHLLGWGACFWVCKPSVQQTKKHAHQEACTPRRFAVLLLRNTCACFCVCLCCLLSLLTLLTLLQPRGTAATVPGLLCHQAPWTLHTRGHCIREDL